jgi:hypothetical protein
MRKKIHGFCGNEIYSFEDAISLEKEKLIKYSELKNFQQA